MARYLMRSRRPRETKLIQRGTLHPITGEVENVTHVRTFVNIPKQFIESVYCDKLYLRWFRSIILFDGELSTVHTGPSQTANLFHSLNNSQRYKHPSRPRTEFVSSPIKRRPERSVASDASISGGPFFRAG